MISASESGTGWTHFPFLTVRDEWRWSHTHTHTHTRVLQHRTALFVKNDRKTGDFLSALPLPQTTAHHCLPFSDAKNKHHPFSYSKHVTVILISKPRQQWTPTPSSSIPSGPYSTFLMRVQTTIGCSSFAAKMAETEERAVPGLWRWESHCSLWASGGCQDELSEGPLRMCADNLKNMYNSARKLL